MLTIAGKLITPAGEDIVGATIRFIATVTDSNGAVKGTMSEFTTDATGDYSEEILPGSYKVEFKHLNKDKYITLGNCTFTDTTGTKALQDLGIS